MVKAVIFDLDGLLIDSEIIVYRIYKEILQEFGFDFSIEEYAQNYSGKTAVRNVSNIIVTYHLPWTVEAGLERVLELERQKIEQGVPLKAGVKKLLAYLQEKGVKIAMASSSKEDRARKILKQHEIIAYFEQFVFGHEVENGKPGPDIFQKACKKLSESPRDCLVLEDSESGIQAAYSAGIPVICIPDLKVPGEQYLRQTKAVLHSLEDVISYL